MSFLLNVIYSCLLVIASPWLLWRYLRWGKNRRGWLQKMFGLVPRRESDRPCIWFHAVSVGEVNLLKPILTRLAQQRPGLEIVISTTTETGFDLANQKYDLPVFFFPFDFSWAVKNCLKRTRPDLIVLAELELWPNFLQVTSRFDGGQGKFAEKNHATKTPVAVINGRLSEKSFLGYERFKRWIAPLLNSIESIMVQNERYAQRFTSLGFDPQRLIITGNVKFDGVETDRENEATRRCRQLANFQDDQTVFLAGSTQLGEDLIVARAYQKLQTTYPKLRLVLAPRHPERVGELISRLEAMGLPTQRRSQLNSEGNKTNGLDESVLIIDVIGELGAWWGTADAAFVGGSLQTKRGGQNMLEPAAYGIPVSFGPNTKNFASIVHELLDNDAATVVESESQIVQFVSRVMEDKNWGIKQGENAQAMVMSHRGAAESTAAKLQQMVAGSAVLKQAQDRNVA